MICENCRKEFFEDWRKDVWSKNNTICRFCCNGCSHSRDKNKEINLKVSIGLKKYFNSLSKEELKNRKKSSRNFTKEERKRGNEKQTNLSNERVEKALRENRYEDIPYKKLRKILLKETNNSCQKCANSMWLDKPIWLEVHHIDDNNSNNKKENLLVVCPNCHSAIDNNYRFSGRKHTGA